MHDPGISSNTVRPLELSLVVLCYKEGHRVRDFVARMIRLFEEHGIEDFELVLVGNYHEGSDDPTPHVVRELSENHPQIVHIAKPKAGMMGWDMRTGLERATGRYIAVIDGDGQMPLADVIAVYHVIRESDHDIVKTYRVSRGDGFARKTISFIFNTLTQTLFPGLPSRDINSKPKIFRREAYEKFHLTSDDWFIDTEIMIHARRHGMRVAEIPTEFLGLEGRKSFIRSSALLEFVKNLLKYRIREFLTRESRH